MMDNLSKTFLALLFGFSSVKCQDFVNTPVFHYQGHYKAPIVEYLNKNHQQIKYQRDSPDNWSGLQGPLVQNQLLLGEDVVQQGFIGPRKKRSATNEDARKIIKDALDHMLNMPLWCWKVYINCLEQPDHVCCPRKRETQLLKRSKREDHVTLVYGVSQRRSDHVWKPYSPYYIGLPGFKKPKGM